MLYYYLVVPIWSFSPMVTFEIYPRYLATVTPGSAQPGGATTTRLHIFCILHIAYQSPPPWIRWGDGLLTAGGNATYFSKNSAKTRRRHKSRFLTGFLDNSINLSVKTSETHFFHTNSSRRIFWCACQLLVVTYKLKLVNSKNPLEHICLLLQHQPKNPPKSQMCQKNQQSHHNTIYLDMV